MKAHHEVDFCLGDQIASKVTSASRLTDCHFHGLKTRQEENRVKRLIMVSFDRLIHRWESGIEYYFIETFLLRLAEGEFDV